MLKKVSVIMNMYNEKREYLVQAIHSYLTQVGCEVELIISTVEGDINIDFVKESYPKIKLAILPKAKHLGKCPKSSFIQINNALPLITGNYFAFASSNDYAYQDKFKLELLSGADVTYSAFDKVSPEGKKLNAVKFHKYDFDKHLKGNFVSDCAIITKRLVDKYLPFNIELNNYAYWDLWLRIYKGEGNVFSYCPVPTWAYRQAADSMHLVRLEDKEKILNAEIDKNRMLKQYL